MLSTVTQCQNERSFLMKQQKTSTKTQLLSLLCTLALIFSLNAFPAFAGSLYPDVDDNAPWAWAVALTTQQGILGGDALGNFNPNAPVTRGEFAFALYQFAQTGEDASLFGLAPYADVPADYWANSLIAWANAKGYMSGYGNGFFGPNDPLLYEQAVVGVIHALDLAEDAMLSGGYFGGYLTTGIENGLLSDVNGVIGAPLTRAQLAILFGKAMQ